MIPFWSVQGQMKSWQSNVQATKLNICQIWWNIWRISYPSVTSRKCSAQTNKKWHSIHFCLLVIFVHLIEFIRGHWDLSKLFFIRKLTSRFNIRPGTINSSITEKFSPDTFCGESGDKRIFMYFYSNHTVDWWLTCIAGRDCLVWHRTSETERRHFWETVTKVQSKKVSQLLGLLASFLLYQQVEQSGGLDTPQLAEPSVISWQNDHIKTKPLQTSTIPVKVK